MIRKMIAIELFANLCGQGIGAYEFFRTILSTDIDFGAARVYKHLQAKGVLHGRNDVFVTRDIRKLSFRDSEFTTELLKAGIDISQVQVDFLFGGPPCFRITRLTAKHRSVFHPMNMLMFEFVRIVKEVRPKVFWMEQVPALLDSDMKPLWHMLSAAFDALDEYEWAVEILDAQHYGGFQARDRVTVIGVRKDLGVEPSFPEPQPVDLSRQSIHSVICAEMFRSTSFKKKPKAPKDGRSHVMNTMTSGSDVKVFRNDRWEQLTIEDRLKLAHMEEFDLSVLPQTILRKKLGMMVLPPFAKAVAQEVHQIISKSGINSQTD